MLQPVLNLVKYKFLQKKKKICYCVSVEISERTNSKVFLQKRKEMSYLFK